MGELSSIWKLDWVACHYIYQFLFGISLGDDKPNDRLDGSEETAENAGAWAMLFGN